MEYAEARQDMAGAKSTNSENSKHKRTRKCNNFWWLLEFHGASTVHDWLDDGPDKLGYLLRNNTRGAG